jgi:O-antigen/teichoic acid export membrane protein
MKVDAFLYLITNMIYAIATLSLLFTFPESWKNATSVSTIRLITILIYVITEFILILHFVKLPSWITVKPILRKVLNNYPIVSFSSLGSTIMVQIPGIYLATALGTAEVASYGVALVIASAISMIFLQLGRALNPNLVSVIHPGATHSDVVEYLKKYLNYSLALASIICGFFFLLAPYLFQTLFPPSYYQGIVALRILLLWVIIGTIISYPILQVLFALNAQKYFIIGIIFGIICSIIFSKLWSISYKATGAAMALLISNSVLVMITTLGVLRELKKIK